MVHPKQVEKVRSGSNSDLSVRTHFRPTRQHQTGKSHLWTNAIAGENFRRTFRTVGPYDFPQEKVWTNDWSI